MFYNTGSGDIDNFYFVPKVNIWNINCAQATIFIMLIQISRRLDSKDHVCKQWVSIHSSRDGRQPDDKP